MKSGSTICRHEQTFVICFCVGRIVTALNSGCTTLDERKVINNIFATSFLIQGRVHITASIAINVNTQIEI